MPCSVVNPKLLLAGLCSFGLSADLVSTPAAAQEISPRFGIDVSTPRNGDDGRVFGQVSAFFPLSQTLQKHLTFLGASGRLNTAGNFGGSVSLGHRLALNERTILGGYLAYDARDTGRQTFSQIGLGAELLNENWTASINGYLPTGTTRAQVGDAAGASQSANAFFQGNQLLLSTGGLQEFESALGGVDIGLGVKLGDFGEYGNLWGTGTAYYLADSFGGGVQLDHRVADRFRLGAGVQSDGIFGTQAFVSVGMSVGGQGGNSVADDTMPWARVAGRDIRRNSSVVVRSQTQGSGTGETIVAINPDTGQTYSIRHVVPDAAMSDQGDGTSENPFTTLGTGSADANNTALSGTSAGDILYVRAGDSATNNLSRFTISSGVQVYSDAVATALNTQLGDVMLPGSGSGLRPVVDGNGINGITLAGNGILLSGFEVTNAANGIVANNANGVVIQNNITTNTTSGGLLVNASNNVTVQNNIANNNAGFGIALVGLSNATVQDNQLADNQTVDFTLPTTPPAALALTQVTGTVVVSGNTVEGTGLGPNASFVDAFEGQGIGLVNTSGTLDLTVEDNTVSGNQGDGVSIGLAAVAEASVAIVDNTIEANGGTNPLRGDGIKIAGEGNSTITQLRIEDNRVNNNIDDGIDVSLNQLQQPASATISNAIIRNNTVNGSVNGQGIILRSNQNGSMQATVQGNTFDNNTPNNTSDGFLAQSGDSARLCLALTDNASGDGFQLSELGSSTFSAVELSAIALNNAGSITFSPSNTDFTSVSRLSDCPDSVNPK